MAYSSYLQNKRFVHGRIENPSVRGSFYIERGYSNREANPDRAPLKEVLGGQYNYREGGRQVLRQGAKGRRRNRKWQCSKDPCAQKVSGGGTDPSPKYRWKVHG